MTFARGLLIKIGATGTNVNDISLALVSVQQHRRLALAEWLL